MLQYGGDSEGGGGKYWALASWYACLSTALVLHIAHVFLAQVCDGGRRRSLHSADLPAQPWRRDLWYLHAAASGFSVSYFYGCRQHDEDWASVLVHCRRGERQGEAVAYSPASVLRLFLAASPA